MQDIVCLPFYCDLVPSRALLFYCKSKSANMLKTLFTNSFVLIACLCSAQVKIGYNPTTINPSAILELSNNTNAAPSTWKCFFAPQVDFTNAAFTSSAVWGIAGTATTGAVVYNIGESYLNGFSGPGLYCWQRKVWAPVIIQVPDKVRQVLGSSRSAYDAAAVNSWVNINATEYANLLTAVSGAASYGMSEPYMTTSSSGGWSPDYTIGGNNHGTKVPASNYIIAWSVRTGNGISSALGSKLKVSASQTTGYTDYGSALPDVGNISVNTRVFFVLKQPYQLTPASPSYTGMYNALTFFLGNNTFLGSGPENYGSGDTPDITLPFASDSYSQVIATPLRQW